MEFIAFCLKYWVGGGYSEDFYNILRISPVFSEIEFIIGIKMTRRLDRSFSNNEAQNNSDQEFGDNKLHRDSRNFL